MNVYDFDNTIYDGESVVDFYLFLLKKNPWLISVLPKMLQMLLLYKMCRISVSELMETAQRYASRLILYARNSMVISQFWDENQSKIKKFYLDNQKPDDVILSASCSFLIDEMCKRLGIKYVISSDVDLETGEIKRLCFRDRKPDIFKEYFPDSEIDGFYTDSMNDSPMFEMAKHVYIVKGNKIKELKK